MELLIAKLNRKQFLIVFLLMSITVYTVFDYINKYNVFEVKIPAMFPSIIFVMLPLSMIRRKVKPEEF